MEYIDAMIVVEFARNSMNVTDTANSLHYHRNTILYHLDKIREKTGLNPRNFFDLGELYTMGIAVLDDDI